MYRNRRLELSLIILVLSGGQMLVPEAVLGEEPTNLARLSTPTPGAPQKKTLMMVEQCKINNTDSITPTTLENKLKSASDESYYFDLKPLPAQLRQQVQVNPESIDWTQMGNPDFLLLNCEITKNGDSYELSANLLEQDGEAPLDVTVSVETPISDKPTTDATNLMADLWKRIDLPLEIIEQGPDLSGLWYNETDGRLISIEHDKRAETVNVSLPLNRLDSSPVFKKQAGKDENALTIAVLPWQRLHGSFVGGKLVTRDEMLEVQVTGRFLEELSDRVLAITGTAKDGSRFEQRWKEIQPGIDDLGIWKTGNGQQLKITKSSKLPARFTAKYFGTPPSNAPWTKAEILIDGKNVFVSFTKKSGSTSKLVQQKQGELFWSSPWHSWFSEDPEQYEVQFEDETWTFINPS